MSSMHTQALESSPTTTERKNVQKAMCKGTLLPALVLELGRLNQEHHHELKASLGYTARLFQKGKRKEGKVG